MVFLSTPSWWSWNIQTFFRLAGQFSKKVQFGITQESSSLLWCCRIRIFSSGCRRALTEVTEFTMVTVMFSTGLVTELLDILEQPGKLWEEQKQLRWWIVLHSEGPEQWVSTTKSMNSYHNLLWTYPFLTRERWEFYLKLEIVVDAFPYDGLY